MKKKDPYVRNDSRDIEKLEHPDEMTSTREELSSYEPGPTRMQRPQEVRAEKTGDDEPDVYPKPTSKETKGHEGHSDHHWCIPDENTTGGPEMVNDEGTPKQRRCGAPSTTDDQDETEG